MGIFSTFLDGVLWIQLVYAVWQFIRTAKFCRLPYIFTICLVKSKGGFLRQHWFSQRQYYTVGDFGGGLKAYSHGTEKLINLTNEQMDQIGATDYVSNDDSLNKIRHEWGYSYQGKKHTVLVDERTANVLYKYLCSPFPIVTESVPLYKDVFLNKCLEVEEGIQLIVSGQNLKLSSGFFYLDDTSSEYLNQNFMRILSIAPLVLQAKGFGDISTWLSGLLIIVDLLSYPLNKLWQRFKQNFALVVKLMLSLMTTNVRVPLHYMISTGSNLFMFCDQFKSKSYYQRVDKRYVMDGNNIDGFSVLEQGFHLPEDPQVREYDEVINLFGVDIHVSMSLIPAIGGRGFSNQIVTKSSTFGECKLTCGDSHSRRFLPFLRFCKENGLPVKKVSNGSIHLLDFREVLTNKDILGKLSLCDFHNKKFFISDFSIDLGSSSYADVSI